MQLCHIHFYQKIARKNVARVNAALDRFIRQYISKRDINQAYLQRDSHFEAKLLFLGNW